MSRDQKIWWIVVMAAMAIALALVFRWRQETAEVEMRFAQMERDRAAAAAESLALRRAAAKTSEDRDMTERSSRQAGSVAEGLMLAEQEKRRAMAVKAWVARTCARFYRETNLTPDQIDRYEAAVVAHWLRWSEIVAAARQQGLASSDPTFAALWKPEAAQFSQEAAAALGPSSYAQLQEYNRIVSAQTVTDAVAGLSYDSNDPITAQQGSALTKVLAESSATYQKGGGVSLDDLDTNAVMTQAANILSPAQLSALQTSLASRTAIIKLQALLKAGTSPATAQSR